jgi:hypothetical protein
MGKFSRVALSTHGRATQKNKGCGANCSRFGAEMEIFGADFAFRVRPGRVNSNYFRVS